MNSKNTTPSSRSAGVAGQNGINDGICVAAIVLSVVFIALKHIGYNLFFFADDWAWLHRAAFNTFGELFSLMPEQIYNDRPVGAVMIKFMYDMFGLEWRSFQIFQAGIHALNCVLVFLIAKPHMSRTGAALAGILAATWIASNTAVFWTAAMFDLLGATLCLLAVLFRQLAQARNNDWRIDILGIATYFLAIRTKEFAIGLVVVMLLMSVLLGRRKILESLKELLPYLVVTALLAGRYVYLFSATPPLPAGTSNPYALHFLDVLNNLAVYVGHVFYMEVFGFYGVVAICVAILFGSILSKAGGWRITAVGFAGFAILLGPTLLLSNHLDPLYLYAPHFFLAIAIGGLVGRGIPATVIALAISVIMLVVPPGSGWNKNIINFTLAKGQMARGQFQSFQPLMSGFPSGSTVFISGVEPYFNPFSYGPGYSIKILANDKTLQAVLEKPEDQLVAEFCAKQGPKAFVAFTDAVAVDTTNAVLLTCQGAAK